MQPLIYALVAVVGMIFGMRLQSSLESDGYLTKRSPTAEQAISETVQHVQSKFHGTYNPSIASDKAINSYLLALDENTRYFRKTQHAQYKNFVDGFYKGYGVEFLFGDNDLYIKNVLKDSPADMAGLKKWDRIHGIENRMIQTSILSPDSIQSLIANTQNDSITINIGYLGGVIETFALAKGKVKIPIVQSHWVEDSTILYVDIDRFSNNVFSDFMSEIDSRIKRHDKPIKYILDLRGNPGGAVDETVKIINQYVEMPNKVILSTEYKDSPGRTYKSTGKAFLKVEKVAVIIDNNSASSSEIVAGALQDMKIAKVFGEPSYGKGSIQQNYKLSNEGSLQLTVGNYILPSGKKISKLDSMRIRPDYAVQNMDCLKGLPFLLIEDMVDEILLKDIGLWTDAYDAESVMNLSDDIRVEVNELGFDDQCKTYLYRHILFAVWKALSRPEETIKKSFSDQEITSAVEYLLK